VLSFADERAGRRFGKVLRRNALVRGALVFLRLFIRPSRPVSRDHTTAGDDGGGADFATETADAALGGRIRLCWS